MKTVSSIVTDWPKALLKRTVPYPARLWLRDQQHSLIETKTNLYHRFIVRKQDFRNRESLRNFDFSLSANHKNPGVSALLRVKNEEEKISYCIKSIYDCFDEIVFVDNNSTDRTLDVILSFKRHEDHQDKIKIYFFPFNQARFGPEHNDTPEDSVHSFTYYSNWSLSKCSFSWVCKWDGDMVLKRDGREAFRKFLQEIQRGKKMCWTVYGQTIYRDVCGNHFLAVGEINGEIRIFPNGLRPRFYKIDLLEFLDSQPPLDEGVFDGVLFYELKFVDTDEFCHWGITEIPTDRKKRELENFRLVQKNMISSATFEKLAPTFLEDQIA
jgi:glycosyltransferase involved in cell wall biosynthesis